MIFLLLYEICPVLRPCQLIFFFTFSKSPACEFELQLHGAGRRWAGGRHGRPRIVPDRLVEDTRRDTPYFYQPQIDRTAVDTARSVISELSFDPLPVLWGITSPFFRAKYLHILDQNLHLITNEILSNFEDEIFCAYRLFSASLSSL